MTSRFLTALILRDDGGLPYTLWLPLRYESALLDKEIVVPQGFKTDLASIPRGLWNIFPKSGKYDPAAVIHDFLYQTNGVTRAQADSVLNEAMEVLQVGRFTRWSIHAAVRLGGWKSWGRYRQADQAKA